MVTVIGFGTSISGTCKAHHTAYGNADIETCKESWGFDTAKTHFVPDDVRDDWKEIPNQGKKLVSDWGKMLERYADKYPELACSFQGRVNSGLDPQWKQQLIDFKIEKKDIPVRQASGQVFDHLWKKLPLIGGSADLADPNHTLKVAKEVFGAPDQDRPNVSFAGRYIHFGTREHAMFAVANGMAAYAPRAFIPVTATFSMFQLYGAAAIRMSALNHLQVIHIGSHDSIAEGACGPTHQVLECLCIKFVRVVQLRFP